MAASDSEDFESADEGDLHTPFVTPQKEIRNYQNLIEGSAGDIKIVVSDEDIFKTAVNIMQKEMENLKICGDLDEMNKTVGDSSEITPDMTGEQKIESEKQKSNHTQPSEDAETIPSEYLGLGREILDAGEAASKTAEEQKASQTGRQRKQRMKEGKLGAQKLGAVKLGRKLTPDQRAKIFGSCELSPEEDNAQSKPFSKTVGEERESHREIEVGWRIESLDVTEEGDNQSDDTDGENNETSFMPVLDELAGSTSEMTEKNLSWGWGGWGTSLLSTASVGVTTLTSHVSQGLSTVLEAGIGAPDPEELVRQDAQKLQRKKSTEKSEGAEELLKKTAEEKLAPGLFGLGNLMSGVNQLSKIVENTGTRVLSGGLDTLEVIGKKTMEVLQDGDPGLKKKRAFFHGDKPVLSQVLRDAKEKAENETREFEEKNAMRKVHFETLFDDFQGLVHLEALEMLSKQCDLKIQSLLLAKSGEELQALQAELSVVKDSCDVPDIDSDDGLGQKLEEIVPEAIQAIGVHISADKLLKTWEEVDKWLDQCQKDQEETNERTAQEIHERAISALAELTAQSVEQFHKTAELLMVKEERDVEQEAEQLLKLTSTMCSHVGVVSSRFSECLNTAADCSVDPDSVNSLITNVFLEASNSSTYIQDAFHLLVPVLQIGLAQ